MLKEPTVVVFSEILQFDLEQAKTRAEREVGSLIVKLHNQGQFWGSTSHKISLTEILNTHLDNTTAAIFAKMKSIAEGAPQDRPQLREVTEHALRSYLSALKVTADPSFRWQDAHSRQAVQDTLAQLDNRMNHHLREFDAGLPIGRASSESGTVTNNVNIGTATNAVVQQAGGGSLLSNNLSINRDIARDELSIFEHAATVDPALAEILDELKSYTGTIRAQLSKPTPNSNLISETGRSLRSVIEGVVGNAVSAPVIESMTTVLRTLGLST
jgi:hypothetical protein